jgi:hypothetical protein
MSGMAVKSAKPVPSGLQALPLKHARAGLSAGTSLNGLSPTKRTVLQTEFGTAFGADTVPTKRTSLAKHWGTLMEARAPVSVMSD